VYVDTSLSRGFRDGQQASILAESGVTGAATLLNMGLANQTYTSLSDRWATPLKLEDEAGSLEITISEESSKININDLLIQPKTLEALQRLGTRLQLPGEIWSAVADWVDSDDLPRSGGAESSYYSALKPPYKARNNKLLMLTELSLVRGVTPEALGKLRPYLTTFSEEANSPLSRININTAPKEVLAALDELVDDRMAEQIIEERRLLPFKSPGELSRVPGMDKIINNLAARITTKGNLFRITSVARVKDSVRTVEAVVRLSGEVLSWQEY
jgi:general secretion pathway protein K